MKKSEKETKAWQKLRSALQIKDKKKSWSSLIKILFGWKSNDFLEPAIDYVREHIKEWPSNIKVGTVACVPRFKCQSFVISYMEDFFPVPKTKYPRKAGPYREGLTLTLGHEVPEDTDFVLHPCWQLVTHLQFMFANEGIMMRMTQEGMRRLQQTIAHIRGIREQLCVEHKFLQQATYRDFYELFEQGVSLEEAISRMNGHHLRHLLLRGCELGDEGFFQVASAPWFAELTSLDMNFNRVSDEGFRSVAKRGLLQHLVEMEYDLLSPQYAPERYHNTISNKALFDWLITAPYSKEMFLFLLPRLTLAQNKKLAKKLGIKGFSKMKKDTLLVEIKHTCEELSLSELHARTITN